MNQAHKPYNISVPSSPQAKYKFPLNLHFLPSIENSNSIQSERTSIDYIKLRQSNSIHTQKQEDQNQISFSQYLSIKQQTKKSQNSNEKQIQREQLRQEKQILKIVWDDSVNLSQKMTEKTEEISNQKINVLNSKQFVLKTNIIPRFKSHCININRAYLNLQLSVPKQIKMEVSLQQNNQLNQKVLIKQILDKKLKGQDNQKKNFDIKKQPLCLGQCISLYDKINGIENCILIVEKLFQAIITEPQFSVDLLQTINLNQKKQEFVRFLERICGKPIFYMIESLKVKHMKLQIKQQQYELFKAYLLNSFCQVVPNKQLVFCFSRVVEQMRYIILNKKSIFQQILSQSEHEPFQEISLMIYQNVYNNQSISHHFKGISLEKQAQKFTQILKNLMDQNPMDSENFSFYKLQLIHKKYNLSNSHFVIFKQNFIHSLRSAGLSDKQIYYLSKKMDGYKSAILSIQSLKDINDKAEGNLKFVTIFSKYLYKDKRLSRVKQKYGKQFFSNHSGFFYQYFIKQHIYPINDSDIFYLHQLKSREHMLNFITEMEIDAINENFIQVLHLFQIHCCIIKDYSEQLNFIKQLIMNTQQLKKLIEKDIKIKLSQQLSQKLIQNRIYRSYFNNNDAYQDLHMQKLILFIIYDYKYYSQNDLRIIHKQLKISKTLYELFVIQLQMIMQDMLISPNIAERIIKNVQDYQSSICYEDNLKLDNEIE